MQVVNAPEPALLAKILSAVQVHRIERYMPAAGGDHEAAFSFYMWNNALSEAFHPSLHYAEVICRNAVHAALLYRAKERWYEEELFIKLLDPRFARELRDAVDAERTQHGDDLTCHHVVSALTFGFWEHLTTKRFERYLWPKSIRFSFPGTPNGKTRDDLHGLIESVRRWRNRIAHHRAIFDKGPTKHHADALDLIRWCCPTTAQWVSSMSRVAAIVNERPDAGMGPADAEGMAKVPSGAGEGSSAVGPGLVARTDKGAQVADHERPVPEKDQAGAAPR